MQIVNSTSIPVTIEYVASKIGITWPTARAVLFQLALEGRLEAVKTTGSWIFLTPEGELR